MKHVPQPPFQDVALVDVYPLVEDALNGLRTEPPTPPVVRKVGVKPFELLARRRGARAERTAEVRAGTGGVLTGGNQMACRVDGSRSICRKNTWGRANVE